MRHSKREIIFFRFHQNALNSYYRGHKYNVLCLISFFNLLTNSGSNELFDWHKKQEKDRSEGRIGLCLWNSKMSGAKSCLLGVRIFPLFWKPKLKIKHLQHFSLKVHLYKYFLAWKNTGAGIHPQKLISFLHFFPLSFT